MFESLWPVWIVQCFSGSTNITKKTRFSCFCMICLGKISHQRIRLDPQTSVSLGEIISFYRKQWWLASGEVLPWDGSTSCKFRFHDVGSQSGEARDMVLEMKYRPGQIAFPLLISRAKPLISASIFRTSTFYFLIKENLDQQFFSRIGKTIKKHQRTYNTVF